MEGGATAEELLRLQSFLAQRFFLFHSLVGLQRSINLVHECVRRNSPVPPLCIKLRRRMLPDHLVLRAPGIDRMAHAVANSDDHVARSEEHTSELQSRLHLVCRLLLEKKRKVHSIV